MKLKNIAVVVALLAGSVEAQAYMNLYAQMPEYQTANMDVEVTSSFLDSLTIGGQNVGSCSSEMGLAYDGETTEWMTGELPVNGGKEVREIYHKQWFYGDGSPAATIWLDPKTYEVIEYKDETGDYPGKVGEKKFASNCQEIRQSNKEAFGEE